MGVEGLKGSRSLRNRGIIGLRARPTSPQHMVARFATPTPFTFAGESRPHAERDVLAAQLGRDLGGDALDLVVSVVGSAEVAYIYGESGTMPTAPPWQTSARP
jgi:hypothetical protein